MTDSVTKVQNNYCPVPLWDVFWEDSNCKFNFLRLLMSSWSCSFITWYSFSLSTNIWSTLAFSVDSFSQCICSWSICARRLSMHSNISSRASYPNKSSSRGVAADISWVDNSMTPYAALSSLHCQVGLSKRFPIWSKNSQIQHLIQAHQK